MPLAGREKLNVNADRLNPLLCTQSKASRTYSQRASRTTSTPTDLTYSSPPEKEREQDSRQQAQQIPHPLRRERASDSVKQCTQRLHDRGGVCL